MNNEQHYTAVREIIDDVGETNRFIRGGGWDLLALGKRKCEIADRVYSDQIVYVIGHRADAQ
jgi:hypothetical protein